MVGIIGMPQQLIMGMPAQVIMQGMPVLIMLVSMVHMSFSMSFVVPSPGIIMHIMPLSVMEQVMRHVMGIMVAMGIAGMPMCGMVVIGFIGMAVFIGSSSRLQSGYIICGELIIAIDFQYRNYMIKKENISYNGWNAVLTEACGAVGCDLHHSCGRHTLHHPAGATERPGKSAQPLFSLK